MIIAVCDDNSDHLNYTIKKVSELVSEDTEILSFTSSDSMLCAITENTCIPDIAILDIKLQGMNGIELAKHINNLVPKCRIIFLSGYDSYVSDVYQVNHVFFIRKDELDKYLSSALSKASRQPGNDTLSCSNIFFKIHGTLESVPVSDILYLERNLRKTDIVTSDSVYSVSKRPEEILGSEIDRRFIRCHQSYWVNFDWIEGYNSDSFLLKNKQSIPVSRSRSAESKRRFFELLQN